MCKAPSWSPFLEPEAPNFYEKLEQYYTPGSPLVNDLTLFLGTQPVSIRTPSLGWGTASNNGVGHSGHPRHLAHIVDAHNIGAARDADGDGRGRALETLIGW